MLATAPTGGSGDKVWSDSGSDSGSDSYSDSGSGDDPWEEDWSDWKKAEEGGNITAINIRMCVDGWPCKIQTR